MTLMSDEAVFRRFYQEGEHVNQHQDTFVLLVKRRAAIRLLRSIHAPHQDDIGGFTALTTTARDRKQVW